jgi:hypothetical protein
VLVSFYGLNLGLASYNAGKTEGNSWDVEESPQVGETGRVCVLLVGFLFERNAISS